MSGNNIDSCGRTIDYLRLSITDRCNLRCKYCMPDGVQLCPMQEILSYEEILCLAEAAAAFGIRHLKVTGGEPLVRRDCAKLCRDLKRIRGIETVTITTNGVLLREQLPVLKEAGIDGINISLDTLSRERFAEITGYDRLDEVLAAADAAVTEGFRVKINTAVMKGGNEQDLFSLAALTETKPLDVRFIEMMPIGCGKRFESLDNRSVLAKLRERYPDLESDSAKHGYGPAVYYRSAKLCGGIGFISAVHGKFCGSCNRLRVESTGKLKYCLCYEDGIDLKAILRSRADREAVKEALLSAFSEAMRRKPKEHCFSELASISEQKPMSCIGG